MDAERAYPASSSHTPGSVSAPICPNDLVNLDESYYCVFCGKTFMPRRDLLGRRAVPRADGSGLLRGTPTEQAVRS